MMPFPDGAINHENTLCTPTPKTRIVPKELFLGLRDTEERGFQMTSLITDRNFITDHIELDVMLHILDEPKNIHILHTVAVE